MKKFECKECSGNCRLEIEEVGELRLKCVRHYDGIVKWHEVVDSAENEQFGNSEQLPSNPRKLPDWVKVGALCYNKTHKKYGKITRIQYDMLFDVINFDNTKSICGVGIFCEEYVQASKRPFNEAEMKALVGELVVDNRNNISLVTDYDFFTERICIHGEHLNNDDLIDYDITIGGKPCYKLEHLENGEWVE